MDAKFRGESPYAPKGAEKEHAAGLSVALKFLSAGPVIILIVLLVILTFSVPNFFTHRNISNILAQIAVIAVVAIGQHLVILTRGIDLSVGANLALATVLGALMFRVTDSAFVVMGTMLLGGGRGGRGERAGLCIRPPAASVHYHAGNALHRQGHGAAVVDRSHNHARYARDDHCHRRRDQLCGAKLVLRGLSLWQRLIFVIARYYGLGAVDLCGRRPGRTPPAHGHSGQAGHRSPPM